MRNIVRAIVVAVALLATVAVPADAAKLKRSKVIFKNATRYPVDVYTSLESETPFYDFAFTLQPGKKGKVVGLVRGETLYTCFDYDEDQQCDEEFATVTTRAKHKVTIVP